MIVIFVDIVGSAEETNRRSPGVVQPEVEARLNEIVEELCRADKTLVIVGDVPHSGDNALLVSSNEVHALRAAIKAQASYEGLAARISICHGATRWTGAPGEPGSKPLGTVVNLASRLLQECPPGGLVINQGMYDIAMEYPRLNDLLEGRSTTLRGLGERRYWVINQARNAHGPLTEEDRDSAIIETKVVAKAVERRTAPLIKFNWWLVALLVANGFINTVLHFWFWWGRWFWPYP